MGNSPKYHNDVFDVVLGKGWDPTFLMCFFHVEKTFNAFSCNMCGKYTKNKSFKIGKVWH